MSAPRFFRLTVHLAGPDGAERFGALLIRRGVSFEVKMRSDAEVGRFCFVVPACLSAEETRAGWCFAASLFSGDIRVEVAPE